MLTYDAERRLATWQNAPSNPTSTAAYWYDGEGHRVAQTSNGVTTYYVGDDEEITGGTLLKYEHIPGVPVLGTKVGDTRTYLASDGLGSETVDLSSSGSVLAQALYGPYGVGRYATGTMPSSKGYTGQRQDSGSGLDYYNARYYDGTIGQFTSADTVQGPNRYGYVGDDPETATDPSGHMTVGTDGVGGDIIVYQAPSPRPNTRAAYLTHFWSDSGDGSGTFNDYKDKTWMFKPPSQWSDETRDGLLLSWYFGVHVSHVMEGKVQGRSYPDYNIYAAGYEGYGLVPFIPNVRFKTFKDTVTVADEYTPDKGTNWGDPASGKKGGILYQAYKMSTPMQN